ncbi:zinc finger protein 69-like isoform X2 [Dermochelys coriacea]|uniref:zinc finger protein 69-like isoform X2 n=1 Tax=Dermochelys coriacea TaxID=27794 RepID=UPI001CA89E44|nr:zinc finger protein 69-like isoform X2 [Dermochelys coriacea]
MSACDFIDGEWSKVCEHLCTHNYSSRPHPCTECERWFFQIAELKEHMAKHKTPKPFLCSLCGQAFKYRCQMSRHHKHVHQRQKVKEMKKRKRTENSLVHSDTKRTARTKRTQMNLCAASATGEICILGTSVTHMVEKLDLKSQDYI